MKIFLNFGYNILKIRLRRSGEWINSDSMELCSYVYVHMRFTCRTHRNASVAGNRTRVLEKQQRQEPLQAKQTSACAVLVHLNAALKVLAHPFVPETTT